MRGAPNGELSPSFFQGGLVRKMGASPLSLMSPNRLAPNLNEKEWRYNSNDERWMGW